jgi:hypothetical protein
MARNRFPKCLIIALNRGLMLGNLLRKRLRNRLGRSRMYEMEHENWKSDGRDASAAPPDASILATALEQIDFLKVEIEHFYQAEVHSEQRASWLLTIAFGSLALTLNWASTGPPHNLAPATTAILAASIIFLCCAVAMALLALWPLQGRRGVLQSPARGQYLDLPLRTPMDLWMQQYSAHRIRAARKAVRVVWALLFLGAGMASGGLAILANAGYGR